MKTDLQLQHDITEELAWDPAVPSSRIGVEVKDGVVTLAGQVDSCAQKWHAERAALRVAGVRTLTTELGVQLPASDERSDADIATAVKHVLDWTAALPADAVKVQVEAGWVTLSGSVEWMFQRRAATDGVRWLTGVKGVHDEISLAPTLSASSVKGDIEAALQRTAAADARKIVVTVDGTDVTLSGSVRNTAERECATHAAWGTPGVRHVTDQLQLTW